MNISELLAHQKEWESLRGINNPNHGLDRTQDELDEALEETDPHKRLVEQVDVLIILAGGMAKLCDELSLPYEEISEIVRLKLMTNDRKYDLEFFQNNPVDVALSMVRHYWEIEPDWEGNDYY